MAKEKIRCNGKPCYLSKDIMKRVALLTLIAVGFIPSFCIAEDGSVSGEKKYSASEAAKDQTERQTVHHANPHPRRNAAIFDEIGTTSMLIIPLGTPTAPGD